MKKIEVSLDDNKYSILIEKGIMSKLGEKIKSIYNGKKIIIITDKNVDEIYGNKVEKSLIRESFEVKRIVIEPGEKSKSFSILPSIYSEIIDFKLTRSDIIIALGGGVVGDLTGFVAATYLRGIDFIQIPTTLLAQVDSSVGGKVAVDLKEGKNLVGAFYHPKAVYMDPYVLETLEERYFVDGMAEVIKYGCIKDRELFNKLISYNNKEALLEDIENILYICCNIKRNIVEIDEKDKGERMLLNFGHTLGHAIEKYFNYDTYTHGEGVAIGMYAITKISEDKGITQKGVSNDIKNILLKYGLPYEVSVEDKESILNIIALDKKNLDGVLNLIVLKSIGEAMIIKENKEFFRSI